MRILLTGATGFVGSRVCTRILHDNNHTLRVAVRKKGARFDDRVEISTIGHLGPDIDWSVALQDIQIVIHAAARVHIMNETSADPLAEFRRSNRDGTLRLARQAAMAGVKRFVFISSIKVNGETTLLNHPFRADDIPASLDPYGLSKHETELGLREIAAKTEMEFVCIRPPLVFGPGVKANFLSMMRWLNKGILLPLGAINNKRSLVALDNLVDLIVTCIDHPNAVNQTFLVSDDEDMSTTEILQRVARALGKPVRLLPVPEKLLEAGLKVVGKSDLAQRLCGSLQVDIGKTRSLLNWSPPVSVEEALKETAEDFLAREQEILYKKQGE